VLSEMADSAYTGLLLTYSDKHFLLSFSLTTAFWRSFVTLRGKGQILYSTINNYRITSCLVMNFKVRSKESSFADIYTDLIGIFPLHLT